MSELALVAETDKYTVVGSDEPEKQNSLLYESEAALERRFIALLCEQGYEFQVINQYEAAYAATTGQSGEGLNAGSVAAACAAASRWRRSSPTAQTKTMLKTAFSTRAATPRSCHSRGIA